MDILALIVGLALPWMLGAAVLRALRPRTSAAARCGAITWTLGCGWFAGMFLLTLWMRVLSSAGVKFGIVAIAAPLAAAAVAAGWVTWRRGPEPVSAALNAALAMDIRGWKRAFWFALLGWVAFRFALLLGEVVWRPLYPWDAWTNWGTKARVWFEFKTIIPFVGAPQWFQHGNVGFTDMNPSYPATVPLLQVWTAVLLGRWDDTLINLPWWLSGVALALACYGFLAGRGCDPLWALAGTWLVVSLPILDAHVALAGYADLPMAAYLTLAVLAGLRWTVGRQPGDALLTLLFAAACVLIKNPGKIWLLVMVPAGITAFVPRYGLRIAAASSAVAIAVLAVLARFDYPLAGYSLQTEFELPLRSLIDAYFVSANWHLLWYGAVVVMLLGWRQILSVALAPLTMAVAAGLMFLLVGFASTNARFLVEDQSTVNRATLHLAPLVAIWMVLVVRAWSAGQPQSVATSKVA